MEFEQSLPVEIAALRVTVGVPDGVVAWTLESTRRLFEWLRGQRVAMLDVEVLDRVQWGYAPAGEAWNCSPQPRELASDFAIRSQREAQAWIESFPRQDVLFVVELDALDTAAEMNL